MLLKTYFYLKIVQLFDMFTMLYCELHTGLWDLHSLVFGFHLHFTQHPNFVRLGDCTLYIAFVYLPGC